MKRAIYRTIPLVFAACSLRAQAPLEFEVATIKPTAPPEMSGGRIMMRMGCQGDPGRINCSGMTLKEMVIRAYGLKPYQVSGPSWIESERWDVIAKIPDGVAADKVPEMWKSLIADRFHLTTRKETKEQNIYALVVGKNGPKLKPAEENAGPITMTAPDGSKVSIPQPQISASASGGATTFGGGGMAGGPPKGGVGFMMMGGDGKMQMRGMTMSSFSDMLTRMTDRPVLNMTDIEGKYDIALEVALEDMAGMKKMIAGPMMMHSGGGGGGEAGPAPDGNPKGNIFSAVNQLGLKLDPRKAPIDFLIVEKAERPSEN